MNIQMDNLYKIHNKSEIVPFWALTIWYTYAGTELCTIVHRSKTRVVVSLVGPLVFRTKIQNRDIWCRENVVRVVKVDTPCRAQKEQCTEHSEHAVSNWQIGLLFQLIISADYQSILHDDILVTFVALTWMNIQVMWKSEL